MKSTRQIVIALLLQSTQGVSLRSNQRQLTSVHGDPPIAPVTFQNKGCLDIYDHSHSVTAPASPCGGALSLPKLNNESKVAKATEAAEKGADEKEAAGAAKETAAAKEALKPKEAGAKPKPKSEAESLVQMKEPAKASLMQLDDLPPIVPVTFQDKECTHTYDHSHNVLGVPPTVCGENSKGKVEASAAKKGKKTKAEADPKGETLKDNRDAKAEEEAKAKADAKADPTPKSGKPKKGGLVQIEGGPDFSKPPTPTFHDDNKCKYQYVSPNEELTQPDAECAKAKEGEKQIMPQGPKLPSLVQVQGPPAITVKEVSGNVTEYDLKHDMTKDGALNKKLKDLDAPAANDERVAASAVQNAKIVKGIKAKEEAGEADEGKEVKNVLKTAKKESLVELQGPEPVMVTDRKGNKSEYDLKHDMTKAGAWHDLDAPAPGDAKAVEKAKKEKEIAAGEQAKAAEGKAEPKKGKKDAAKAKEAPAAAFTQVGGPEPVTVTDRNGNKSEYDLKHDMAKAGAWHDLDAPSPNDARSVKSAEATAEQTKGIQEKSAKGEAAPKKEKVKKVAPAALVELQGPEPVTVTDRKGNKSEYDLKHDMTKASAWHDLDAPAPGDAKAVEKTKKEKEITDAEAAKTAAGEPAPKKKKQPGLKGAKPKDAALVEWDFPADPSFRDKSKCKHTYISPRKVQDFGLDMDAECEEDKKEEQSVMKPKAEKKDQKAKIAAAIPPLLPSGKQQEVVEKLTPDE